VLVPVLVPGPGPGPVLVLVLGLGPGPGPGPVLVPGLHNQRQLKQAPSPAKLEELLICFSLIFSCVLTSFYKYDK
jgi:hypothetical protein